MTEHAQSALEKLVQKAGQLYSLPSVAMEVLRLSENGAVDVRQLKETIERDPALAAKLLRVVNSSLFGLRGEVSDLNQALALLGVEPLKMLVLGFSLPDALFVEMAGEPLRRYWAASLTRAVCARRLADHLSSISRDEAFLAGLLRSIGQLVLAQQLGTSYLSFLEAADSKQGGLLELERETLGFDHTQLSAQLLYDWQLPVRLAGAVGTCQAIGLEDRSEKLALVVELAELMVQLLLEKRLELLPDLLDRLDQACGLSEVALRELIEPLSAEVDQLAAALQLELTPGEDYRDVLVHAHRQMSQAAEALMVLELDDRTDDEIAEQMLAESHEVRLAVRRFLNPNPAAYVRSETAHQDAGVKHPEPAPQIAFEGFDPVELERLAESTGKLAVRCRLERRELSLALLQGLDDHGRDHQDVDQIVKAAIQQAKQETLAGEVARVPLSGAQTAVLMPGVDRGEAVRFASAVLEIAEQNDGLRVKAGVAAIAQVPNRFDAGRLVQGAVSCLNATRASGSTAVKSIEVY